MQRPGSSRDGAERFTAADLAFIAEILRDAEREASRERLGGRPLTLNRVLRSYERLLSQRGQDPSRDTVYYRALLRMSTDPSPDWWQKLARASADQPPGSRASASPNGHAPAFLDASRRTVVRNGAATSPAHPSRPRSAGPGSASRLLASASRAMDSSSAPFPASSAASPMPQSSRPSKQTQRRLFSGSEVGAASSEDGNRSGRVSRWDASVLSAPPTFADNIPLSAWTAEALRDACEEASAYVNFRRLGRAFRAWRRRVETGRLVRAAEEVAVENWRRAVDYWQRSLRRRTLRALTAAVSRARGLEGFVVEWRKARAVRVAFAAWSRWVRSQREPWQRPLRGGSFLRASFRWLHLTLGFRWSHFAPPGPVAAHALPRRLPAHRLAPMRNAAATLGRDICRRILAQWRRSARETREFRLRVLAVRAARYKVTAFWAWRLASKKLGRLRRAARRVAAAQSRRRLRAAWARWVAEARRGRELNRRAAAFVRRLRGRRVVAAFETWQRVYREQGLERGLEQRASLHRRRHLASWAVRQLACNALARRSARSQARTADVHFASRESRAVFAAWRARLRDRARSRALRARAEAHWAQRERRRALRVLAVYALFRGYRRLARSVPASVSAARNLLSPRGGEWRDAGSASLERFARRQADARVAAFARELAVRHRAAECAAAQFALASARTALRRLARYRLARCARRWQLAKAQQSLAVFRAHVLLSLWHLAAEAERKERARAAQARLTLLAHRVARVFHRWQRWAHERRQSARRKGIADARRRRTLAAASFRRWRRFARSRALCIRRFTQLVTARRARGVRSVFSAWRELYRSLKVERIAAAHKRLLERRRAWRTWRSFVARKQRKRAQMARAVGAHRHRQKKAAWRAWRAAVAYWRKKRAAEGKAAAHWQRHAHRGVLQSWRATLTASRKKRVTYQRADAHFGAVRLRQLLRAWRRVACEERDLRERVDRHVQAVLQRQARDVFRALHETAHRQSVRRRALSETVRRHRSRAVRRVFAAWRLWAAGRRRALHLSRRVAAREFRGRMAAAFDAWHDYIELRRWKRSRLAVAYRFHRRGLARFVFAAWRLFGALVARSRELKALAAAHARRALYARVLRAWRARAARAREVRERLQRRHGARVSRDLTASIRALRSFAAGRRVKRLLQEKAEAHWRRARLRSALGAWRARARGWVWRRNARLLAEDLRQRHARRRCWAAWQAFLLLRFDKYQREAAADKIANERLRGAVFQGWRDALVVHRVERMGEACADRALRRTRLAAAWRRWLLRTGLGRARTAAIRGLLVSRWRQELRLAFRGWRSIVSLKRAARKAVEARRLRRLRAALGVWRAAHPPRKRHLARVAAAAGRLEARWRLVLARRALRALAEHARLQRIQNAAVAAREDRALRGVFPAWRAVTSEWRGLRVRREAVEATVHARVLREALFRWRVELARGVQLLDLRRRILERDRRTAAATALLAWRYYRERNRRVRAFVVERARRAWQRVFEGWRYFARVRAARTRSARACVQRRAVRMMAGAFATWRLRVQHKRSVRALARAFARRHAAAASTGGDARLLLAARRWRAWPIPAAFDAVRAYAARRKHKRAQTELAAESRARRLKRASLVGWFDAVAARHAARASDAYWTLQRKGYWLRRWRKMAAWRARRKRQYTQAMMFWAQHASRRMLRGWRLAVSREAELEARLAHASEGAALRAAAERFAEWRARLAERREWRLAGVRAQVHADFASVRRCVRAWRGALHERRTKMAELASRMREARRARLREFLVQWRAAARLIHRLRTQGGELRRRTLKRKRNRCFAVWRQWATRHRYCRRAVAIFLREKRTAPTWQAWRIFTGLARWTRLHEAKARACLSSRLARRYFSAWQESTLLRRQQEGRGDALARRTALRTAAAAMKAWRACARDRVRLRGSAGALLARRLLPWAWREWRRQHLRRRESAGALRARRDGASLEAAFEAWRRHARRAAELLRRRRTMERDARGHLQAACFREWATRAQTRSAKRDMLVRAIAWIARNRADRILRHWCAWAQHAAAQRRAIRQQLARRTGRGVRAAFDALRQYALRRRRARRAIAAGRHRLLRAMFVAWAQHHAMYLACTLLIATRDAFSAFAFGALRAHAARRRQRRAAGMAARLHCLRATLRRCLRAWTKHAKRAGDIRYAVRRALATRQLRCLAAPFGAWHGYARARGYWRRRLADAAARVAIGALRRALRAWHDFARGARATRDALMRRERREAALAHAMARARARALSRGFAGLRAAVRTRRALVAARQRRAEHLLAHAFGEWVAAAAGALSRRRAADRMRSARLRSLTQAAFRGWQGYASMLTIARGARVRVRLRTLGDFFGEWRGEARALKAERRRLALAFGAWALFAAYGRRLAAGLEAAVRARASSARRAAFAAWRACAAERQVARERVAQRAWERRRARVAGGVVRAWRQACVERREGRRRVAAAREYRLKRLGRAAFAALRAAARAANWQRSPSSAQRAAELSPIAFDIDIHSPSSTSSDEGGRRPLHPLASAARLASDFLTSAAAAWSPAVRTPVVALPGSLGPIPATPAFDAAPVPMRRLPDPLSSSPSDSDSPPAPRPAQPVPRARLSGALAAPSSAPVQRTGRRLTPTHSPGPPAPSPVAPLNRTVVIAHPHRSRGPG